MSVLEGKHGVRELWVHMCLAPNPVCQLMACHVLLTPGCFCLSSRFLGEPCPALSLTIKARLAVFRPAMSELSHAGARYQLACAAGNASHDLFSVMPA